MTKLQYFVRIILLMVYTTPITMRGQTIPTDSLYLGQLPPDNSPKVFVLPTGNGYFTAERIAISHDGREIYFNELNGYPPTSSRIKCLKYFENKWNGPYVIFDGYGAPGLSSDDQRLYLEGGWVSARNDMGWDIPTRFWNTSKKIHYLQRTNTYNYYLTSDPVVNTNGDISKLVISESDTTVQSLGVPLNSPNNGIDFFISRDESFMIVVCKPNGRGSLFISYHKANGTWTNPKNMGNRINDVNAWQYGPYVTDDNKYLFFSRLVSNTNAYNIYWVRIENIIDSLKQVNTSPYLYRQMQNRADTLGHLINFRIPDSTFIDDDGNNTLVYAATLDNGNPLPPWLFFDSTTRTFAGTPASAGTFRIKLIATDTAGASVSCSFNVVVVPLPGMADVFPLAIGNRWEYSYRWYYDDMLNPVYSYSDTGTVAIQVIDKIVTLDSTRWYIQEDKMLWDQHNGGPWLPIAVIDTVELVELHEGRHRLYRTGSIEEVRHSVFPFLAKLTDTSAVFRYCPVDTAGVHSFGSLEEPPAAVYSYNFKKGVGEFDVDIHDNCLCSKTFSGSHTLRTSSITGISIHQKNLSARNYALDQNYPNPFNPTTVIQYTLAKDSYVTLKVYSVLGKEVAELVNGERSAGSYTTHWDATHYASGIYFYKLQAGLYTATKKLVLMK